MGNKVIFLGEFCLLLGTLGWCKLHISNEATSSEVVPRIENIHSLFFLISLRLSFEVLIASGDNAEGEFCSQYVSCRLNVFCIFHLMTIL